ncbi:MAG: hypothetical protein R3C61_06615 [Bacteroidia bacterium]
MKFCMLVISIISISNLFCTHFKDEGETNKPERIDTLINSEGIYLFIKTTGEKQYVLVWGNTFFQNVSNPIKELPNGKIRLKWYNKQAICVEQGCGTSCFFSYILPIQEDASEKFYMYPLAYNQIRLVVVYSNDGPDGYLLRVQNVITGKEQKLIRESCKGPFAGYCINKIEFEGNFIRVNWVSSNGTQQEEVFALLI